MAKKRKADEPLVEGANNGGQAPMQSEALESKGSRRKKATQARTLRACDRCQHRKLACDGALDCCQQCQKANTWCTMTDPVTGVAYYRGQFDYLERRVQEQNQEIKDLLTKLRAIGQEVSENEAIDKETERYQAWVKARAKDGAKPWEREERLEDNRDFASQHSFEDIGTSGKSENAIILAQMSASASTNSVNRPSSRPATQPARNFVGVSANNVLSKTKPGTRLNILGWELEIANFIEEKDDEFERLPNFENPVYDRSYRSFIATTHGLQPRLQSVKLPSRQQGFNYALQQLHTMGAFIPVLHRPSLTELLTKFYDEREFRPSIGQEVCIHMAFSIAYYQTAARNFQNDDYAGFHELSDQHYHYSLGFWPQLMIGNTLEDMQGMAMISAHTRTFPKPEVGWIAMSTTFNRLIQLDYHRSAMSEQAWVAHKSFLELEMRKRIFWSILVGMAVANGKLGRPMPLRWEDFDVEFPLAVNDEQLTANGRDESKQGQCHFLPAIESFRIEPIFSDLYSTLYALRKFPRDPVQFIDLAEKRLQAWWDSRHPDLQEDSSNPLMQVFAQYLRSWTVEYRLLLYHPSLSLSDDPSFNKANLKKCIEAAKALLGVVKILKDYKNIDTTWYNCAVYILAIQTTLYGHNQFRDELTTEKMDELRSDMDCWLSIMGDVGCLLGSGLKLKQTISRQVKEGLTLLQQHLDQRTSSTVLKRELPEQGTSGASSAMLPQSTSNETVAPNNASFTRLSDGSQHPPIHARNSTLIPTMMATAQHLPIAHFDYHGTSRGPFEDPANTAYSNVHPLDSASYGDQSVQPATVRDTNANMFMSTQPPSNNAYNNGSAYETYNLSWYQYTQTLANGMAPQDYQPATALLQLGGRSENDAGFQNIGPSTAFAPDNVNVGSGQAWPLVILDPQPD